MSSKSIYKICPKCSKNFDAYSKWGERKFCSRSCANSRKHSNETKQKISIGVKSEFDSIPIIEQEKRRKQSSDKIRLVNSTKDYTLTYGIKKRVLLEQDHKCNRCGLSEWLGEHLILELEHKDGNHTNDSRNNVECLCPNCHSLTTTWRGRNKKGMKTPAISVDGFKSIRQYLLANNLTPKGGNYKMVKRKFNLE